MNTSPPAGTSAPSSGGQPPPRDEELSDLVCEVLSREAEKQGKPPPSAEQCREFQRLMEGLPSGPEDSLEM
jgi:hypothetical protein